MTSTIITFICVLALCCLACYGWGLNSGINAHDREIVLSETDVWESGFKEGRYQGRKEAFVHLRRKLNQAELIAQLDDLFFDGMDDTGVEEEIARAAEGLVPGAFQDGIIDCGEY